MCKRSGKDHDMFNAVHIGQVRYKLLQNFAHLHDIDLLATIAKPCCKYS